MVDLSILRRDLRAARASLAPTARRNADQSIARRLVHHRVFRSACSIGVYLSTPTEVGTSQIIRRAWRANKRVSVPVIGAQQQMRFAPFRKNSRLVSNRFDIVEPQVDPDELMLAEALDLVLLPLLGFTDSGQRLGMGGGFYDRFFASNLHHHGRFRRPRLIGLAYQCQHLATLPQRPWDVPLDGICTETQLTLFGARR